MRGSLTVLKNELMLASVAYFSSAICLQICPKYTNIMCQDCYAQEPLKKRQKIANGLCGLDLQYRRGFTTDAVQVADDCSRNSKSAAFECRKVECIMRYRKNALKVKLHFVTVGYVTIVKDRDLSQYAGRPCLNGECVGIGASL